VRRAWQAGDRLDLSLSLASRLTEPHPRVESTLGCVAIERGPLVYCLEQADHRWTHVLDLRIDAESALEDSWQADLLRGVFCVHANG
jgi:DUF1680 family protein